MSFKLRFKQFKRRLLAPFQRIERKIKAVAERFVVKSLKKHGHTSAEGAIGSGAQGANKVLMAFLQANQSRLARPDDLSFEAIPVGAGRFLVRHPSVAYAFVDGTDIHMLPRVAMNRYQEESTLQIERSCNVGDTVLHLGAGQGFHTLSIAESVGESGRVVAVESCRNWLETLQINLESHYFETRVNPVQLDESAKLDIQSLLVNGTSNLKIVIDENVGLPAAWFEGLCAFAAEHSDVRLLAGSNCQTITEYIAAHRPSSQCASLPTISRSAA